MSFLFWFCTFVFIALVFSLSMFLVLYISRKDSDDDYFIIMVEEFPPTWHEGGIVKITTELETINFQIKEFLNDQQILVKEVKH